MSRRRRTKERLEWKPQHAHDWLERGHASKYPAQWDWMVSDAEFAPTASARPLLAVDVEGGALRSVGREPTLFWMTEDMDDLVYDAWEAATDEDKTTILDTFEAPCPHGMLLYEGADKLEGMVAPDMQIGGMEWAVIGGRTWWRPVLILTQPFPDLGIEANCLLPMNTLGEKVKREGNLGKVHEALAPVIEYVAIAVNLMMTPTVVERSPLQAEGRAGYVAAKAGRPIPEVNLLRLRPMRYENTDTDGQGRAYRHRFVVSGHWRNQPYGKGRKKRRRVWVNPYIKGPDGAPLLNQKKVFVWAR